MVSGPVDPAWVRRVARQEDFDQDSFERAYRLAHLLREVGEEDWLAPRLVLKGGTCVNFFHAPLPRLSADIDLNYIGSLDREDMLRERPEVEQRLQDLAREHGYTVDAVGASYIMGRFSLRYENAKGTPDSIKADVNYLMRLPLYGVERRELPAVFDLDPARVPCWTREEVMGSKLKALAVRGEARDLFDAARFFEAAPAGDARRLRKAFLFYAHMDDARMGTVDLGHIESLGKKELSERLYPLLRSRERPTAHAMRGIVLPRVEEMLALTEREVSFGERLLAHAYDARLLFEDVEVADGIERHPAGLRRAQYPRRRGDEGDT